MLAEPQPGLSGGMVLDGTTLRRAAFLAVVASLVYLLFSYGGIRSPDSEVVFRTAEALATRGTFAVDSRIAGLADFGLPPGVDGRFYSLFGPGQSLAAVPLVDLGILLNTTHWYDHIATFIPVSHYSGGGIFLFVRNVVPNPLEPHALRCIVSMFNIVVGGLCVFFFFLLVKLVTQSDPAAWAAGVLLAFGTLLMPYSGTFFSEPLATLFVILSLFFLTWNDLDSGLSLVQKNCSAFCSGLFLGIAVTVHISAILFAPFFFAYAVVPCARPQWSIRRIVDAGALFAAGVGVLLLLLAYFNYERFGNVFQTGRTVVSESEYATFVAPWRGLFGLLLGSGKGLVWYCPALLIAALCWPSFHRRFPALSYAILGSFLLRLVFIASRSDWHGGFSLGPRYMVMAIPLLVLPVGYSVSTWIRTKNLFALWSFFAATLVCIFEQVYFSLGEIFSFLHSVNWTYRAHGINVFFHDALYLDWDKSPLLYLGEGLRGPFLLRNIPLSNGALFGILAVLSTLFFALAYIRLLRKHVGAWH